MREKKNPPNSRIQDHHAGHIGLFEMKAAEPKRQKSRGDKGWGCNRENPSSVGQWRKSRVRRDLMKSIEKEKEWAEC